MGPGAYKTRFDLSTSGELQSSSALFTTNTPDLGGREVEREEVIKISSSNEN
jgi:hypothetical protein